MRNLCLSIAYTLTICITMMLSACRSTRETIREEKVALSTETSQSSAFSDSSLERFFSELSLSADSIIFWFGPSIVAGETGMFGRPDSLTQMEDSIRSPGASPRIALSRPEGMKIYGYRADASKSGERVATRQNSDSVRSQSSAAEQFTEQLVKSPRTPSLLELLAAVGIAALIAGAYILYERLAHK